MEKWLFKILVCSVNVFILAYILPGISIVKIFFTAILVAVVLSLLGRNHKTPAYFTHPARYHTHAGFIFYL